ncbi:GBS Bsp-like repeat-containing protein [Streptococcus gallolyticus]|uniref:GBS Bsp-like repeat-containing protein n=1 Tax=Streptococcus gallolyticus TaxID=315405 RepID=UPI001F48CE25|nr:GBS Bsp-like repeat-containing protein [Streptococcus gallolyticus]MCF1633792.1 GBS Bsp-like repeat-containing protein [Streptococcus gallolyticus]
MKKSMFGREEQRFGIRKYSVGVASVLIASVLFMGGQTVAADDVVSADAISTETVADVQKESENSSAISESNVQADVTTADESTEAVTSDETDEQAVNPAINQDTDGNKSEEAADVTKEEQAEASQTVESNEETTSSESNENEVVTVNVSQASKNVQTNQAHVFEESKIPVTANNLPNQGYYTYTKQTEVKNTPKASAPVAFYANAGDRIFYDQVLSEDGYQWISYKSYSGQRRYAAIQKLTPTAVQKLSGKINIQNVSSQGFEVLVTDVSDPNGVVTVKLPVWTDKNDQDDIIWYDGVKQSNGDYKVSVKTAEHKGETGNYNVHLYYLEQNGKLQGIGAEKVTVPEKTTGAQNIPEQGSYTFNEVVEVKNEPKMSAPTEFTFEKGFKLGYYDKVLEADNHQWISYVSYGGVRRYIPIATLKTQAPTGKVDIQNHTNGDFDVIVSDVSDSNGIKAVKVPVWTVKNDQDDIIWYDAVKQSDGTYKVNVKLSEHKNERGDYNVHLYYQESDGTMRGMLATKTTVEAPKTSVTGKVDIKNHANGDFDVIVSDVSDSNGIKAVKVPVWTVKNDQDDIIWYDAVQQSDGTYKVNVKLSDHKNECGDYNVHLYYQESDGTMRGMLATKTTVEAPKTSVTGKVDIKNHANGDFDVIVSNVSDSNGIKAVKVPVWTVKNDQDDIIWYDGVKQSDGTYKVNVKLSEHKNERGDYNIHLYYQESNGAMRGVLGTKTTVAEAKTSVTGKVDIKNHTNGDFDVIVSNVSDSNGIKAVKVPVWTVKNDQDDIIWYDAVKQSDGTYKVNVKLSEHKNERGDYNVHLYYQESDGKMRGVLGTKTTVAEAKLSGQLAITNQSTQGFDVIISEVSNPNGVKTVKVPVWSTQGGQDDIIWYNATKQNDGTYKVAVNVKDHKNNSGEYNVHLYYEQNDGSLKGVSATRTTVEAPKSQPAPDMPQSGTYVFTSPKEVKSQPKVSAPTEFTLDKGYQIHYDQAFSADGHQWISYVSYGGLRRYVLIN